MAAWRFGLLVNVGLLSKEQSRQNKAEITGGKKLLFQSPFYYQDLKCQFNLCAQGAEIWKNCSCLLISHLSWVTVKDILFLIISSSFYLNQIVTLVIFEMYWLRPGRFAFVDQGLYFSLLWELHTHGCRKGRVIYLSALLPSVWSCE